MFLPFHQYPHFRSLYQEQNDTKCRNNFDLTIISVALIHLIECDEYYKNHYDQSIFQDHLLHKMQACYFSTLQKAEY